MEVVVMEVMAVTTGCIPQNVEVGHSQSAPIALL
jgi:hypothetical protein